jgi:hypothetical protein
MSRDEKLHSLWHQIGECVDAANLAWSEGRKAEAQDWDAQARRLNLEHRSLWEEVRHAA